MRQKSGLNERIQAMVNRSGAGQAGPGGIGGKGGHHKGGMGVPMEALPQILGMTQEELQAELAAGRSLVEIAGAKGISKADLIAKIKESMTDSLTQFVEKKRAPRSSSSTASPTAPAEPAAAVQG